MVKCVTAGGAAGRMASLGQSGSQAQQFTQLSMMR
jgi:hypothetical protein